MAYNSGFPVTYQPLYYQPQYPSVPQQQTPALQNNNIVWVQGEAAARGYLMAPNTTLPLWDSENNTIYLKTTDAAGMPSMKILDYSIRDTAPAGTSAVASAAPRSIDYATKADVDALYERLMALKDEVDTMASKRPASKKKEGMTDE